MVDIAGSEQKQVVMSLETVSAQDVVPLPTSYWPGCDLEQFVHPAQVVDHSPLFFDAGNDLKRSDINLGFQLHLEGSLLFTHQFGRRTARLVRLQ